MKSLKISFGTDGWRGIIGKDVTYGSVEVVAQAYADYLHNQGTVSQGVMVGYDCRFLSEEFASLAARVLAANGVPVLLTAKATATPVVSYGIRCLGLAGGLVITASHNPPIYNGIKIKGYYGGSATPEIVRQISSFLYQNPVRRENRFSLVKSYDADTPYLKHLRGFIDLELLKGSGYSVLVDPMYGSGTGYVSTLLENTGISVCQIRGEYNPGFGKKNPEPAEENLRILKENVIRGRFSVGLATDGDGDRVGAVDDGGMYVDAQKIYAILLWHQLSKGTGEKGVGKTFSTTKMIDKLAAKHRLQVWETPIGFKYQTLLFLQDKIFMGGEESGGVGLKAHLPERDGILNSLLLMEAMAYAGMTLGQIMERIWAEIGPHYYQRVDLHLGDREPGKVMGILKNMSGCDFGETGRCGKEELDGLKFVFSPSRWLLFRLSGTEPVIRIYAEAEDQEKVKRLLDKGKEIISSC